MDIYQKLNEVTDYIEEHLEDDISYDIIAKKLGTNLYTARKIFQLLIGTSVADYIRKRRLSVASYDLRRGLKITDIAVKYQYESPAAFSRAFKKYHGVNPSSILKNATLANYPRIVLPEKTTKPTSQKYKIIKKPQFRLYGFTTPVTIESISEIAPDFFAEISTRFNNQYGHPPYGMVSYNSDRSNCKAYSVLYSNPVLGAQQIVFPESDWLIFRIPSQVASDIQEQSKKFYLEFLPSCKYNLCKLPELEYYHDEVTDFLVAIEKI